MPPLPTPYDITPIPFFPFIPGPVWWVLLFCAIALLAALVARVPLRRSRALNNAFSEATTELNEIAHRSSNGKEKLTAASLTARRFLAAAAKLNLRSATGADMRRLAQTADEVSAPILHAAAELEERRFQPVITDQDAEQSLTTLLGALRQYHSAYLAREKK